MPRIIYAEIRANETDRPPLFVEGDEQMVTRVCEKSGLRPDGFSLGSSKRAVDLLLKVCMLRRGVPGRPHAAFFSGTPFTNTLAEAHVWQQFLAPEQLAETGLGHFDAWAAQFIRYEVLVEVAPDGGGFRSRRWPAVIQNLPELRTMLAAFMSMGRNRLDATPTGASHRGRAPQRGHAPFHGDPGHARR